MWFTLGAGFMAPQLIKCDSKAALAATTTSTTEKNPLEYWKKKIYSNYGLNTSSFSMLTILIFMSKPIIQASVWMFLNFFSFALQIQSANNVIVYNLMINTIHTMLLSFGWATN